LRKASRSALARGSRRVLTSAAIPRSRCPRRALSAALLTGALGAGYDAARLAATAQGRGLRLALSLGDSPALLSVPWELLYRRPTFLASQRRTPVVRYLETGRPLAPQRIEGAVRVLGVVASPRGLPVLDVADERRRVEEALEPMIERALVELDWCDPATPRRLRHLEQLPRAAHPRRLVHRRRSRAARSMY